MVIINLFGGPGSGKSTAAAGILFNLKMLGIRCDLVTEFAKDLVYKEDIKELDDQFNIFAQQNNKLKILKNLDLVITDSPLVFSALYPNRHYPINSSDESLEKIEVEAFEVVVCNHFKKYSSVNFFLNRKHQYDPNDRTQDETEADKLSIEIKKFLAKHSIQYIDIATDKDVVKQIINILKINDLTRKIMRENIKKQ